METGIPDDPMTLRGIRRARTIRSFFWLGCLWIGSWLGIILEQAISWTDTWQGIVNGAMTGIVIAPMSLIMLVPLGLIGRAIGSIGPLRPYRWWISLALPLCFAFLPIEGRVRDRIDPGRRFERFTKVRFPAGTRNLEVFNAGGMFFDITDTYTFECQPAETERLIRELKLRRREDTTSHIMGPPGSGFSPAARGWAKPALFRPENDEKLPGHTDFMEMFVDETGARVHIIYGTI